jgi:FkbM family methyltransferase
VLAAKGKITGQFPEVVTRFPGLLHPIHIRLRSSDAGVFKQVLLEGEYHHGISTPPHVIVDAGANIGLASVFYANKYPEARIIAIEPEESNYEMLKRNTVNYRNIIAIRGALWKEDKDISVVDPGRGEYGFQTKDTEDSRFARTVGCVRGMTVDGIMRNFALNYIDVLKIDIEGSEKEVFENSRAWINKVGVIAIELHDSIRPGCSRSFYQATKEFSHEIRSHETVFLMRDRPVLETQGSDVLQPASPSYSLSRSKAVVAPVISSLRGSDRP